MTFAHTIVRIAGPLAILSGLACAAFPAFFAEQAGLAPSTPGLSDVRAIYGGLQVGLGAFLLWCARAEERVLPGLVALGLTVGVVGLFRVLALLVDGEPTAYHFANLAVEVGTTLLVVFAATRLRAPQPA